MPNRTAPRTRGRSISLRVGKLKPGAQMANDGGQRARNPAPLPETSAAKKEAMKSEPDQMTQGEAGYDGCRHEQSGRHERAPREPGNTADAMTAGAAATETCAEADQESTDHDERPKDRNREVRQFAPAIPLEHGAAIIPIANAILHATSPVRAVQSSPTMPLIPAIRPLASQRMIAESPISTPPMDAEMGVKCYIKKVPLEDAAQTVTRSECPKPFE